MHPDASYEENACQHQYQKFPHDHPEKSKQLSGKKIWSDRNLLSAFKYSRGGKISQVKESPDIQNNIYIYIYKLRKVQKLNSRKGKDEEYEANIYYWCIAVT